MKKKKLFKAICSAVLSVAVLGMTTVAVVDSIDMNKNMTTVEAASGIGLKVGSTNAKAGENFTVNVDISGLTATGVNFWQFDIKYDPTVVSISSLEAGNVLSGFSTDIESADCDAAFYDEADKGLIHLMFTPMDKSLTTNGTILKINGKVNSGVTDGSKAKFEIVAADNTDKVTVGTFNYDSGDIESSDVAITEGTVTVGESVAILKGDVNGDGKINSLDVIILKRYLAGGWSIPKFNEANADISGDGSIKSNDVILLSRHLAGGWGNIL